MRILMILLLLLTPSLAEAQLIQNGDVNGDGSLDVGDVVYQLSYLFQNGPSPVLIPHVLADVEQSVLRFTENGDGTITDLSTGLMWTVEEFCIDLDDSLPNDCEDPGEYFNQIELGGYVDWRTPSIQEFLSTVPWGLAYLFSDANIQCYGFLASDIEFYHPLWFLWDQGTDFDLPYITTSHAVDATGSQNGGLRIKFELYRHNCNNNPLLYVHSIETGNLNSLDYRGVAVRFAN